MFRNLTASDLFTDYETYKLWRSLYLQNESDSRRTPQAKGLLWERCIFNRLYELGFRTLAGRIKELQGISGIMYRNDVLMFKRGIPNRLLIVECKSRRKGSLVDKDHVQLFYQRMQDIFAYYMVNNHPKALLPCFVSLVPLDGNAFRFCLTYRIISLHPCFGKISNYPITVSCRPPLGALRHRLSSIRCERPEMSGVAKGLLKSINRLYRTTVGYVSHSWPERRHLDGNRLEKAYNDILYRSRVLIDVW